MVIGYNEAEGTGQVDPFLPLCDSGYLQQVRCGMDGGPKRKRFFGQKTDQGELQETGNRSWAIDHPCGPGISYDCEEYGTAFCDLGGQ